MARTRISLIGERYDCVKPLFDGAIQPEGVELVVTRSPSPEAMRRQLTAWEFDICEMAFGAYLIARNQGADVTAIPVFPRRAFFHTNFMCHANARIDSPRDLANKRIGVAEYVQSATLWARGVLEHDFGLEPHKAQW
jgi:4,5-dihydroxyphthalate decarboxylase